MAPVCLLGSLAMARIPTRGVENSVWPQFPAAISFISSAELLKGQYIIPGYGIRRRKYPATLGPPSTLRVELVWEPDSCGPISLLMPAAQTDVLMYKAYIGWWFHHLFKFPPEKSGFSLLLKRTLLNSNIESGPFLSLCTCVTRLFLSRYLGSEVSTFAAIQESRSSCWRREGLELGKLIITVSNWP